MSTVLKKEEAGVIDPDAVLEKAYQIERVGLVLLDLLLHLGGKWNLKKKKEKKNSP